MAVCAIRKNLSSWNTILLEILIKNVKSILKRLAMTKFMKLKSSLRKRRAA